MPPNTDNLIEMVATYPALYDTSHPDYKNIKMRNHIWGRIAEILESDGESLKKQWKNLRDAYSKHLHSLSPATGKVSKFNNRYKGWPWASLMSFMRPHLLSSEIDLNETDLPDFVSESPQDDSPQPVRSRHTRTYDQSQSQAQLDNAIHFISNSTEDDVDLLFKSYAMKLKKMSDRRQSTVKFEIARIMLRAELEELDGLKTDPELHQIQGYEDIEMSDSIYIGPPPVLENIDPLNTKPSGATSSKKQKKKRPHIRRLKTE